MSITPSELFGKESAAPRRFNTTKCFADAPRLVRIDPEPGPKSIHSLFPINLNLCKALKRSLPFRELGFTRDDGRLECSCHFLSDTLRLLFLCHDGVGY